MTQEAYRQEVVPFISALLGINHIAFKLKIIDTVPKNEVGKKLYKELEQYYD